MEKFVRAIAAMMPKLQISASKTDMMLERTAANMKLTTEKAIADMTDLIARKQALVAVSYVCGEMFSLLTPRELTVLKGRSEGITEESIARELGVCRMTVHNVGKHALKKCGWYLTALKKSGYDFSVFEPLGLTL